MRKSMSRQSKPDTTPPIHFESAIATLETLIEQMAKGNLSLEDSLRHFEQGISLTRQCQSVLKTAEQKVQLLIDQNNDFKTIPFVEDE
jgi:exodeoxyribonuclease VII small subunit